MILVLAPEFDVIPAKAGIHFAVETESSWIPAFAGMMTVGDDGEAA
jgi:hypothetical protein